MIHSETPVQFMMKHLYVLVSALVLIGAAMVGGFWTVVSNEFSGVRDDMGFVRQSISKLQGDDMNGAVRLRETEGKLAGEIAKLNTSVVMLSTKIDGYNDAVARLSHRLDEFQKQIATRQARLDDPKSVHEFAAT